MLCAQSGSFIRFNQLENDRSGQSQETNCGQETQNELIWVKVTTRLNGKIINFGHFTCPLIISGLIRSWNCSKFDSKNFQTYIETYFWDFSRFCVIRIPGLKWTVIVSSYRTGPVPRIPNSCESFFFVSRPLPLLIANNDFTPKSQGENSKC